MGAVATAAWIAGAVGIAAGREGGSALSTGTGSSGVETAPVTVAGAAAELGDKGNAGPAATALGWGLDGMAGASTWLSTPSSVDPLSGGSAALSTAARCGAALRSIAVAAGELLPGAGDGALGGPIVAGTDASCGAT